ncbi:MAG: hypothetical protein ACYCQJ_12560 [Nitrososphaerales archaeon]
MNCAELQTKYEDALAKYPYDHPFVVNMKSLVGRCNPQPMLKVYRRHQFLPFPECVKALEAFKTMDKFDPRTRILYNWMTVNCVV